MKKQVSKRLYLGLALFMSLVRPRILALFVVIQVI